MKERPILMSGAMVPPTLDGSKTQTRRILEVQPPEWVSSLNVGMFCPTVTDLGGLQVPGKEVFGVYDDSGEYGLKLRYGQPGDRLWVRERYTLGTIPTDLQGAEHIRRGPSAPIPNWCCAAWYEGDPSPGGWFSSLGKKPSIHMPRWASRITLEIVSIRVERLQSISEADAIAEGVKSWRESWDSKTRMEMFLKAGCGDLGDITELGVARALYRALWEKINGAGSWDANPWVAAIEFKKVEVPS